MIAEIGYLRITARLYGPGHECMHIIRANVVWDDLHGLEVNAGLLGFGFVVLLSKSRWPIPEAQHRFFVPKERP